MNEDTIIIKLKDGDPLNVCKRRLTEGSRMFRYLIEELNFDELDLEDFSSESVTLFVTLLDLNKSVWNLETAQFREQHKLGHVFEVVWLVKELKKWLECRMRKAESDEEKVFTFEESLYIRIRLEQHELMNSFMCRFSGRNNYSFVLQYMAELGKLEVVQIDLMLILGGCNTELFLRIILMNLENNNILDQNSKYLLSRMDLTLCWEQNKDQFLEMCEKIQDLQNISAEDMKFAFKLTTEVMRSASSRSTNTKERTTEVFNRDKERELWSSCGTINGLTDTILGNIITSMFEVVDLLLEVFYNNPPTTEEIQALIAILETSCRDRHLQKVSKQYLDTMINSLNYSSLSQRVELISVLKEITNNNQLSSYHENVILNCDNLSVDSPGIGQIVVSSLTRFLNRDESLPSGAVQKDHYSFKHPAIISKCTEPGNCGFILKFREYRTQSTGSVNYVGELCSDSIDYTGTGLHVHDVISASDMFYYYTMSSKTAYYDNKVTVIGGVGLWLEKWFPDITGWKYEQVYVAYNVSDYVVAKQD